jgi:hypothetical protein
MCNSIDGVSLYGWGIEGPAGVAELSNPFGQNDQRTVTGLAGGVVYITVTIRSEFCLAAFSTARSGVTVIAPPPSDFRIEPDDAEIDWGETFSNFTALDLGPNEEVVGFASENENIVLAGIDANGNLFVEGVNPCCTPVMVMAITNLGNEAVVHIRVNWTPVLNPRTASINVGGDFPLMIEDFNNMPAGLQAADWHIEGAGGVVDLIDNLGPHGRTVQGLGVGTVDVIVTIESNLCNFSNTAINTVEVTAVPVPDFRITPNTITMQWGERFNENEEFEGEGWQTDEIIESFESENENIVLAGVDDNGNMFLRARGAGTVTVTATTSMGREYDIVVTVNLRDYAYICDLHWESWTYGTQGTGNPAFLRRRQSAAGAPLMIRTETFERGIGTVAMFTLDGSPTDEPADIVVDISGGEFTIFTATVGIDQQVIVNGDHHFHNNPTYATVVFQILADGVVIPGSTTPVLTRHHAPYPISVNIPNGAGEITLRVLTNLGQGDNGWHDWAVWGYATLSR